MSEKQKLINEMEELLEKVNSLEEKIREIEMEEYSDEDLQEMRKTIYMEIEINAQEQKEDTPFFTYGNASYRDYIMAELKASSETMNQEQIYQYAVNSAALIVEWLCWLRTHESEA